MFQNSNPINKTDYIMKENEEKTNQKERNTDKKEAKGTSKNYIDNFLRAIKRNNCVKNKRQSFTSKSSSYRILKNY